MKELSKEDKERIEAKAYKEWDKATGYLPRGSEEAKSFVSVYINGHTEGFNEGIEAARNVIWKERFQMPVDELIEELQNIKK